ncbi:hypothetical protein SAMN02745126_06002 [Enhydrobacter aerosaccus]|uniref:Holin-X, holin superfamily III n=1 Tax=Enhydrobacter aerosaccus TaxID=225324 RepID=A0A1T4TCL5_9HYPH|nr:hypothetical protein [Enhydrobacter aerosaccus]SKA38071.1 hypothetical protein SAMN02745126_06002 [Enhydrobacter aerosaccus]
MIGPILRLATTTLAAGSLRAAAGEVAARAMLTLAAFLGGVVAVLCFSYAALTLLERQLDPAGAWAIIGVFYALLGLSLYFAASRRRR